MGIEDIFQALEKEGQKKVDGIISRAEMEAKQMIDQAHDEAERIEREIMNEAEASLRGERARLLNNAKLSKKKEIIKAKEDYIQQAFKQAKDEVKNLRDKPKYKNVFTNLTEEVLNLAEGKVTVSVDPKDEAVAKDVLSRLGNNYEIKTDISCIGGLRARAEDGKISYINTLDSRLEKANQITKAEVATVFFG